MLFQLWAVIAIFTATVLGLSPDTNQWTNVEYKRDIFLQKTYAKEKIELTIKNTGNEPSSDYYFAVSEQVANKIAFFSANHAGGFFDANILSATHTTHAGNEVHFLYIKLDSPVAPEDTVTMTISMAYMADRAPFPEAIAMGSDQMILLQTNRLPLSAYKTETYILALAGASVASELEADSNKDLALRKIKNNYVLGPVSAESYEASELKFLYKHNFPMARANTLKRDIWVSHWASTVQFEEYYEITNDGAKLDKGFSRADWMVGKYAGQSGAHLVALEIALPNDPEEIFYTDKVGMVDSKKWTGERLYLKPRYPLFGGWRYNFTVGWTNQLSDFVRQVGSEEYVMSVPMLNGPIDIFYDDFELSVILPEGAEIVDVLAPAPFVNKKQAYELSYFDLDDGHVKTTIHFKNLVDDIGQGRIMVKYVYSSGAFYKKPLSIAAYVFVALISYFAISKINLKIKK